MPFIQYIGTIVIALTMGSATRAEDKRALPASGEKKASPRVLRIGAVAYAPSAVTVFENLRHYFAKTELPIDYVLYSNYDALVDALRNGHVDVAWNTPLAHARYHILCKGQSQTLVMRDVDCNFRCKLLVRKESGIKAPSGLQGKTLALGSREAAEATVLPFTFSKGRECNWIKSSSSI
jgi:phosphonate transport system substrate-binding protein